jgi:hypothetical protein
MRAQRIPSLVRARSALALMLVLGPVLGACTKTGQFDPTEVFNSDVFDSKKKLSGQREAVFPSGVPGTTTGVPADLVKGYQPPPDPSDAAALQTPPGAPAAGAAPGGAPGANASGAGAPAATAEAKPKPKPKPKPKLATAPAPSGSAPGGPMHLTIGSKSTAPAQNQGAAPQSDWPAQGSSPAQTNWPTPSGTAPAQKTAQPSQSNWPNPPAATQ